MASKKKKTVAPAKRVQAKRVVYTRQDIIEFLAKRARDCDGQSKELKRQLRREGAKPHDLYAMEAACIFQKSCLLALADEVANGYTIA